MATISNSQKIWRWILILLIINTLAIAWLLLAKIMPPPHPSTSPTEIGRVLNFDEKQKQAFDILIEDHFKIVEPIRADINKLKLQAYDMLKDEKMDTLKLKNTISELSIKISENEIETRLHFRAIRDLCNDSQKQIFDNTIVEKFKTQVLKKEEGRNSGPHLKN